jgi:hypothetical protein
MFGANPGFMCHMVMTYETITPFLKGLHLTLASFLSHRGAEGCKLSDRQWLDRIKTLVKEGKMSEADARRAEEAERAAQRPEAEWYSYIRLQLDGEEISEEEAQAALDARIQDGDPPPEKKKGIQRFGRDLFATSEMLAADSPPEVNVRSSAIFMIVYGLASVSGKGFGGTIMGKDGTRYRIGIWDKNTKEETSNFREFENVAEALEEEAEKGNSKRRRSVHVHQHFNG